MSRKDGMTNIGWIVAAVLALVALGIMLGILSGGFKIGWDSLKEALGIPSKHLEAWKVPVPEIEEIKTEAEKMRQFLAGAAENVKAGVTD